MRKSRLPVSSVPCVALALTGALTSCLSSGVRSTGTSLPQASTEFGGDAVSVRVSHNCSSNGRCSGFEAEFTNNLDEPLEVVVSGSRISRAGVTLPLARDGGEKGNLVIGGKQSATTKWYAVSPATKQRMSYVKSTQVWCSVKVDSACTNTKKVAEGESMCAGFARYYHQSYVSAHGWISVSFAVRAASWSKPEFVFNAAPEFQGAPPAVRLAEDTDAPSWGSSSGEVVYHKVFCDEKCRCRDAGKPRNFHLDDRFLPMED